MQRIRNSLLPGQDGSLHVAKSWDSPVQLEPPCAGTGLSQLRPLVLLPLPHVTEQCPYVPQSDQPPSTGNKDLLLRVGVNILAAVFMHLCEDSGIKR